MDDESDDLLTKLKNSKSVDKTNLSSWETYQCNNHIKVTKNYSPCPSKGWKTVNGSKVYSTFRNGKIVREIGKEGMLLALGDDFPKKRKNNKNSINGLKDTVNNKLKQCKMQLIT